MQRVTISLEEDLAEAFDALIAEQGYTSRSEAIRDVMRKAVQARPASDPEGACVASLSYVYNHHTRALAQRLTEISHDHHDLVVSTMHVHLDHDNCLETSVLKGDRTRVRAFAERLWTERGVHFGELNLIPINSSDPAPHSHVHAHTHAGDEVQHGTSR
jgi:CopG family nickel-responsive transcriptional regulator